MAALELGSLSISQAQLVAIGSLTVVLLFLLVANAVVCWLYRRASTEDRRQSVRETREKKAKVWVYHGHRTVNITSRNAETASQQILRKIQTSHENLIRTRLSNNAQDESERQNSLRLEEAQALEELEVTADLFLHETSCSGSRRSSFSTLRGGRGVYDDYGAVRGVTALTDGADRRLGDGRRGSDPSHSRTRPYPTRQTDIASAFSDLHPNPTHDLDKTLTLRDADNASATNELDVSFASSFRDLDVVSALADLDMASALDDFDLDAAVSDTDKVSVSSVTMADFENDDPADLGHKMPGRKKRISLLRRSKRKGGVGGSHGDRGAHSLPVAEFHNEAFDFTETHAAVERVKDVEL